MQSVEESRKRFEAARQIQEIRQKIHGAEVRLSTFLLDGACECECE